MISRTETTLCPRVFTVSPLYTYTTFLSNPSYSDGKKDSDNATTTLPSSDIPDASFIEGIWRVFSKSGISAILFLVDEYASGNIKSIDFSIQDGKFGDGEDVIKKAIRILKTTTNPRLSPCSGHIYNCQERLSNLANMGAPVQFHMHVSTCTIRLRKHQDTLGFLPVWPVGNEHGGKDEAGDRGEKENMAIATAPYSNLAETEQLRSFWRGSRWMNSRWVRSLLRDPFTRSSPSSSSAQAALPVDNDLEVPSDMPWLIKRPGASNLAQRKPADCYMRASDSNMFQQWEQGKFSNDAEILVPLPTFTLGAYLRLLNVAYYPNRPFATAMRKYVTKVLNSPRRDEIVDENLLSREMRELWIKVKTIGLKAFGRL